MEAIHHHLPMQIFLLRKPFKVPFNYIHLFVDWFIYLFVLFSLLINSSSTNFPFSGVSVKGFVDPFLLPFWVTFRQPAFGNGFISSGVLKHFKIFEQPGCGLDGAALFVGVLCVLDIRISFGLTEFDVNYSGIIASCVVFSGTFGLISKS